MAKRIRIELEEPITLFEAILRLRSLSKQKASKKADMPRVTITRVALAQSEPRRETRTRISDALGISHDVLLDQQKRTVWTLVVDEDAEDAEQHHAA